VRARRAAAVLGFLAALAPAGSLHAQQSDAATSVARVRAALEKPPSALTLQERTPDFTVHIEKRRPMQDIFDTPPWQLPPIGWQPPAWGTGINLMSIVGYVAKGIRDAKYAHEERKARDEVRQTIAEWCAAQENRGAGISICR
jgi:hypothetical protein